MNDMQDDIFLPGASARERELYRQWCKEYRLAQLLDDICEPDGESDLADHDAFRRRTAASSPYSGPLQVGEIRILSSELIANPDIVPYFAVIGPWEGDFWLIMPFSRFSVPASAGEIATGLDFSPLRVLQVWNARTAQASLLTKSWSLNESLPENIRQAGEDLFRHLLGGRPLPEDFALQRGPALHNPLDIRHNYLAEASAQFAVLTNMVAQLEQWRSQLASVREACGSRMAGARAGSLIELAAAAAEKDRMLTWQLPEHNAYMTLTIDAAEKRVIVAICDRDGESSSAADQHRLLDYNGRELALISDGFAEFPLTDDLDRLALVTPEGVALTLVPQPESE